MSAEQNRMTSVMSRTEGRGGKTYSFWAWYSFKMSFCSVPERAALSTPQIDTGEEGLHVVLGVDGHAGPAHFSSGPGIVGVATEQRRHVERSRQPVATGPQQFLEPTVGVGGRAEAGELAHRPQAGPVHGGVGPARIGVLARQFCALGSVDGLQGHARHRLEASLPPGRTLELLLPGLSVGHRPTVLQRQTTLRRPPGSRRRPVGDQPAGRRGGPQSTAGRRCR